MSIEQIRERSHNTGDFVSQEEQDVMELLAIIDNLQTEAERWLNTKLIKGTEKSQEWYSLGKRHAAELVQGIIKGEIAVESAAKEQTK